MFYKNFPPDHGTDLQWRDGMLCEPLVFSMMHSACSGSYQLEPINEHHQRSTG
ncbi:MAG TPA: hypothetical protein VK470_15115 [Bacteroidota bacterium]|nr:hypothetical protein [Bacteroidota bacterium]